jgi:molybdate transport system ATP-binding protein
MLPITLDVQLEAGTFTLDLRTTLEARAVALFGPSGAGKTTVLETIAGLRRPRTGRIGIAGHVLFDARAGIDVPPRGRRVGYVPQDLALFPHLDVRRNVLFGATRGSRLALESVLSVLDIGGLLDRRLDGLSGGERQRVALARALMSAPDVLLLDEPLAALDTPLRHRILEDLRRVRDEIQIPLLYVSHDVSEVRRIAEWVVVLEQGRLVRAGHPNDVFDGR